MNLSTNQRKALIHGGAAVAGLAAGGLVSYATKDTALAAEVGGGVYAAVLGFGMIDPNNHPGTVTAEDVSDAVKLGVDASHEDYAAVLADLANEVRDVKNLLAPAGPAVPLVPAQPGAAQ